MIERAIERTLFASRWLLAPFFLALALSLFALLIKTCYTVYELVLHFWGASESQAILSIFGLVDLTLTGSLIVVVIFSGYKNFVSRIEAADHADWPEWMSKIDFTGLKLKLLSSIVAISAVQLLRGFMDVKNTSDRELTWYVIIHLVFVASGFVLALTDKLSERQPSNIEDLAP